MREYKTSPFGYTVDLDDPDTYKYYPTTVKELDKAIFAEIGYAHCYMTYIHPIHFQSQREKVEKFSKHFVENRIQNYENVLWFQEQLFLIQDEIENMC